MEYFLIKMKIGGFFISMQVQRSRQKLSSLDFDFRIRFFKSFKKVLAQSIYFSEIYRVWEDGEFL